MLINSTLFVDVQFVVLKDGCNLKACCLLMFNVLCSRIDVILGRSIVDVQCVVLKD